MVIKLNFDPSRWTKLAKSLLAAAIAYGAAMSVPDLQRKVTPYLANHPVLTSWFAILCFIIGLLHNPMVYDAVKTALDIQVDAPGAQSVDVEVKQTTSRDTSNSPE